MAAAVFGVPLCGGDDDDELDYDFDEGVECRRGEQRDHDLPAVDPGNLSRRDRCSSGHSSSSSGCGGGGAGSARSRGDSGGWSSDCGDGSDHGDHDLKLQAARASMVVR